MLTNDYRLRATVTFTLDYDPADEDYVQDGGMITLREMAAMDSALLDAGVHAWVSDSCSSARSHRVEVVR